MNGTLLTGFRLEDAVARCPACTADPDESAAVASSPRVDSGSRTEQGGFGMSDRLRERHKHRSRDPGGQGVWRLPPVAAELPRGLPPLLPVTGGC